MGERRIINGFIYEKTPNGIVPVGPANAPAMGPAIGNDPKLPGALTGQSLQNTRTQQEIANNPLNVASTQQSIAASRNSVRQSQIGNVQELRKEFNSLPEVKAYSEVLTQLGKALRASPGKQGDLTVIYAYAKAMDPGSVVREGEMDMAKETASIVSQLKQKYKSFLEGNGLPPEVRHGLVEEIRNTGRTFNDAYTGQYRRYSEQALRLGANPDEVVGKHLGDSMRSLEEAYVQNAKRPQQGGGVEGTPLEVEVTGGQPYQGVEGPSPLERRMQGTDAFGAGLVSAVDALTLGLSDEAGAGVDAFTGALGGQGSFGDLYRRNVEENRQYQDQLQARNPYWSFGGSVAGSLGGLMGTSRLLANAGRLAPLATRGGGIGAEAAYGAAYGAGSSDDNRLLGAGTGALAAAAGNVAGNRVLAPAMRGVGRAFGYNPAPALSSADNMVAGQAIKADPLAVQGRMQEAADLNMPFTLADADSRLRALGGSVVRKSQDAFSLADRAIGNRGLGQVDRLTGIVENDLGPRLNLPTFKADVLKSAQTKSRPLYESAKQQPPVDDAEIAELLRTPAGQRAARSGYDEALNNGEPVGNLVPEVDSITGEVRLVGQPSWPVLQRMKFALDAMPDQEGLARRFNSRLGSLNSDFKKANLTYAKEMRRGDIAEAGYSAASPNVRPPELNSAMAAPRNMKEPDLFRQAYGSNLVDKIRGMRDAANPYEVASISSPDQLAKMQAVSPTLANRFGLARGLEGDMAATNRELFGGSPTAPRQEADKMFESGALGDALDFGFSLASGTPPISAARSQLMAGRGMFAGARDALRLGVGNAAKKKADELAPILFNPDAQQNLFALTELMARKQARDEYVRRTGMIGSGVVAPISIGLYGQQ